MTRKRTSENDLVVSATGAAAPARRKTAARPRAKRAAEPAAPLAALAPEQETVAPQADAVVSAVAIPAPVSVPSHEEIAALAYSYWLDRGCEGGSQEEDWLRAEQELRNRASSVAVA